MNTPADRIGANRIAATKFERTFKKGSLMFIEGETSTEMYIIKSGKIRILKQEGESSVELAILGAGSVLGELSLLDHQPRGATAQVLEDVGATIIDDQTFEHTIQACPSWLSSMVRTVVKRLRDTMKKTSLDVVRKNVAGVIKVLVMLNQNEKTELGGVRVIMLARAKEAIYTVIGLGGLEVENVFLHLILKDFLRIKKNDLGQEYIVIKDEGVMQLYMTFLRARQRNEAVPGENMSDAALDLLAVFQTVGPRVGRKITNGLWQVAFLQIENEYERAGKGKHIDLDALDELTNLRLIVVQRDAAETRIGKNSRTMIVYNADTIERMQKLRTHSALFREEIEF